ncbi:hypothetical protein DICPUDRAFT_17773, partial [Dictyostelium purpureum]
NSSNRSIDIVFFLVWRNTYLLKLVHHHQRLYIKYEYGVFNNIKELNEYRFKDYLKKITLQGKIEIVREEGYTIPPRINTLEIDSDSPIMANNIPDSIDTLHFGMGFNKPLYALSTNLSLTSLSLGHYFNTEILPGDLPVSLKTLIFDGCTFGRKLRAHISFSNWQFYGSSYNKPFQKGALPPSLTHLELSEDYNHPFKEGDLPPGLLVLAFGKFDQPIKLNQLPNSLQYLKFGPLWNHPLSYYNLLSMSKKSILPNSLTHLDLSYCKFDQVLSNGDIPSTLKCLKLPKNYNKPLL